MKLLSRSQANAEAARNKKAQIDEGIKIATRVDVLRKTLSDLEKQHEEYVSKIKEEGKSIMSGLEREITALREEVAGLLVQKNKLQVPLDAEWEKATEAKTQAEETVAKAKTLHSIVEEEKKKQEINSKKIKESLEKSRVRERALRVAFIEASEDRATANVTLKQAQELKETQDKICQERQKELDEQERVNNFNFAANENKANLLNERERNLNDKERQINDKYETLQRTINRLNKK